jgi:threonine/homoserine/homoserine lactone efflux protein
MDLLLQGILMGLALAIMVGPILFALVQTSLDRGVYSGLVVGSGIWISDILYIIFIFTGFAYIENVIQLPDFEFFGGIIGGVILLAIGIGMILSNQVDRQLSPQTFKGKARDQASLWFKGFVINTVNPFTVFFWVGVVSSGLGYEEFTFEKVGVFFIALMGTIIITDALKVILAAKVRKLLTDRAILNTRKISGLALIVFGIALMLRVSL